MKRHFHGKNVLITGGLGFIGSNLAIKLVELGANVTLADAMLPDYGGNLFNIEPVRNDVSISYSDIRDETAMEHLVRDKDFIFHLAGQVCHIKSLSDPFPDIDINIKGTAVLMEACKKYNRDAIIVYTGTRGQYGPQTTLPVNEDAPLRPKGIYEVSNLAAEQIMKIYNDVHKVKAILLRLTNVYGPRAQMKHSRYGVVNWFVRQAVDSGTIKVFGDGKIIRDFLYVDDAVSAILMCTAKPDAYGEILNVGSGQPSNFLEMAEKIIDIASRGDFEFVPFSAERRAQEPGDFFFDITKVKKIVGWEPKTLLDEGLKNTIDYYCKFKKHYWNDAEETV